MGDDDDRDLEERLGSPPGGETSGVDRSSVLRRFVGRPRIWVCVVQCLLGIGWLVLNATDPALWRFVLGSLQLVLGGLQLAIAIRDRRLGRGVSVRSTGTTR